MDVLVLFYTLPHHLINVVDVILDIELDVRIQSLLVLFELFLLLDEEHPSLLKIFVEVEPDLVFDSFLDGEDVVFHHAMLPCGDIQLINEVVASREHFCVDNLVQFFLGVLQLVLQVEELLVFGVEQVLILQDQEGELLASRPHFDLTELDYAPAQFD